MPATATTVWPCRCLVSFWGHANVEKAHTYNYTLRQRRSDETLRGSERHKVFVQAVVEGQVPRVRNFLRMGVDLDETGSSDLTILHRAVLSGHQDVIEPLIEAGADVNANSDDFGTPLCLAALKGMHDTVCLLVKYKAKARTVTRKLGTALHCCAASTGHHKATITTLLDAGAHLTTQATIDTQWLLAISEWDGDDQNQIGSPLSVNAAILYDTTPAFVAVRLSQRGLLELLLPPDLDHLFRVGVSEDINESSPPPVRTPTSEPQSGKDGPSRPDLLHTYACACARTGDLVGLEHLIANGAKIDFDDGAVVTPLMVAVGQGNTAIAKRLLDQGASIDRRSEYGLTALHCAVSRDRVDMVRMLCELGASIDATDKNGCTALGYATCSQDCPEIINALCEHGATIDMRGNTGYTALHIAVSEGYGAIARALCEHGADLDAKADDGSTPLHLAAAVGHSDTVRLLCEHGAAIDVKNNDGRTPLHLGRNHRIIHILCKHGAKIDIKDNQGDTPFSTVVGLLVDLGKASYSHQNLLCLQAFIDAGWSINTPDSRGRTPLLSILGASEEIDIALVEDLIRIGANTRLRAYDGTSVLRVCFIKPFAEKLFTTTCHALGFDQAAVDQVYSELVRVCQENTSETQRERKLLFTLAQRTYQDLHLIVSLGANLHATDSKGETAMHEAARLGDCAVIHNLFAAGADLNNLTTYSAEMMTPLAVATTNYQPEAVRMLLRCGADPCSGGYGQSSMGAVGIAVPRDDERMLRFLGPLPGTAL